MKKFEYRCSRCLIIEERWTTNSENHIISVPCHKCGGLALRIPWSKWQNRDFEDFQDRDFEDFQKISGELP